MIKVGFKRLHNKAEIPSKATQDSAGFDVYSPRRVVIEEGTPTVVKLGFAVEIPTGYCMRIIPRSGLASKGLTVANSPGLIDADYRGEVGVILQSTSGIFGFDIGDRICQITFEKVVDAQFVIVDEISETERGEGGFGHTGN